MLSTLCVGMVGSAVCAETTAYDAGEQVWLVDPRAVVSRNDVVYNTPSPEPWEAMPTGGGDLSAMVRWDGSLRLHLTKSDCWGFQEPPEAFPGSRYFNNVSPGHVRVVFGPGAENAAARHFRQRLDLYRGRVTLEIGEARLAIWGHPDLTALVVEVSDPAGELGPAAVELSEWRDTMAVGAGEGVLWAREIHERPARPHLANTGMDEHFREGHDPLKGRGTAVVVSSDAESGPASVDGMTARVDLGRANGLRVLIAAAVTPQGEPRDAAREELRKALTTPAEELAKQHQEWWREYWGRSFLRLTSDDKTADWLTAAYHVHLYTLGCTNRGAVPAKWDGGAGLMVEDQRNWGISEWVQEVRFTYLPLYAANRLEMACGMADHYSRMTPYLRAQTRRMWHLPGLWIPETVTPWGHAEDLVLETHGEPTALDHFSKWDPEAGPYGRFERYNPYVAFLFTAGLEVCWHYLTYARYSGDEGFLREQAYPVIRGVAAFVTSLLREGDDGRYHLEPANALETWWMVRDPTDTMDGMRAILPEFIRLSEQYDADRELRERCADVLSKLPDPPRALWREDGTIDETVEVYAPAAAMGEIPGRRNCENPQLYRVFPFGLSGIGSDDYDLAKRTFQERICVLAHGWAMDAIWAARLGLAEQACSLLAQHARKYNRFRYGGWDSNDSNVHPEGLAAAPFLDAGGLSAYALQEAALQSHGGSIRVGAGVSGAWSGVFRLRAEGGFMVAADIEDGEVRLIEVESLQGKPCALANPWSGECVVKSGGNVVARLHGERLLFETEPGAVYLAESADRPAGELTVAPFADAPNENPGLPGRD